MIKLEEIVVVRGMTEDWFLHHFKDMEVYFGGDPRAIPARNCMFVGFYLEAPEKWSEKTEPINPPDLVYPLGRHEDSNDQKTPYPQPRIQSACCA